MQGKTDISRPGPIYIFMRFKIGCLLLVSFIILILGCAEKIWLPKSYLKENKIRSDVYKQVEKLKAEDHYFSSFFIKPYVNTVVNSLNNNNGQAILIAEDGLRYVKITCIPDSDENYQLTVQHHSKNFGELFKEKEIDQKYWIEIINSFNTGGHEIVYEKPYAKVTLYGDIMFTYDFKGDSLLVQHKIREGWGQNSYRMIKIR